MSQLEGSQHYGHHEQLLCKKCGLCCDGTLFENAKLTDDDLLPLKNQGLNFLIDEKNYNFKLPCRYHFKKSCLIYLKWRPRICTGFVCRVIQRLRNGELRFSQAAELIEHAVSHSAKMRKMLAPFVGDCRQSLECMFNLYLATHPAPDQSIILEYAALQHRLKRDFHKKRLTRQPAKMGLL